MPLIHRSTNVKFIDMIPAAAKSMAFAKMARGARDELVRSKQAPPVWNTWVDGVKGASEDKVKPGGTIRYEFNQLGPAAIYAVTYLLGMSPRGAKQQYVRSWVVLVNGTFWRGNLLDIPSGAEVAITNTAPYHRKIETGAMKTKARDAVDKGRKLVMDRFASLHAERQFLLIPGGYVLKGHGRRGKLVGNRKYFTVRSDVRAGDRLTYPALVLRQRIWQ